MGLKKYKPENSTGKPDPVNVAVIFSDLRKVSDWKRSRSLFECVTNPRMGEKEEGDEIDY